MEALDNIINYKIFSIGKYHLEVSTLFFYVVATILFFIILKVVKKSLQKFKNIEETKSYSIYNLFKYFLIVLYIFTLLDISGFNLSLLFAGSAALLVGLGLGIQNLFNDFISGIILLIDSSIKVNDIIEIDGLVCRVRQINLRTTLVTTRDSVYILLPNSSLTKNNIVNYTHNRVTSRFKVDVGVDYSSDPEVVIQILKEVALENNLVKARPEPIVRLANFEDSSLLFTLLFWSDEVFRVENLKSSLRVEIYKKFKERDIKIPFPQRVIHTVTH